MFTLTFLILISGEDIIENMNKKLGNFRDRVSEVKLETVMGERKEVKKVKIWEKGDRRIIKFTYPRRMRGVGILIANKGEIYLWMPSYSSVKRITTSTLYTSFMGTDFSYAELTGDFYKQFHVESTRDTEDEYIITMRAKEDNALYSKLKLFINRAFELDSIKFYSKKGRLKKKLKVVDRKEMDGCLIPTHVKVYNTETGYTTNIYVENVKINSGLKDSFFSKRNLRRLR